MKSKRADAIVLFFLYAFACLFAYFIKDIHTGQSLLVLGAFTLLPTIYLGLRERKNWKKIVLATITFGFLYGFALSFYAEFTKAWTVDNSLFPFRILGVNTLEEVLGHGMMTIVTFTFYEHFFDDEKDRRLNRKYFLALGVGILGTTAILLTYKFLPTFFQDLKYPYFYIGIIAIIPTIILVIMNDRLLSKMLQTWVYFFILWFTVEIFAVMYNYWWYPGNNYIGFVELFDIRYPFEELFFWMLLYAPTLIVLYERFCDDEK